MPRQRIDYTSLREWRKEHGLTIGGEREATTELLAFEHGIQPEEITAKEVER